MSVERLLDLARAQGLRVTAAESCTGGMVMAALTDVAGSSAVVERGFVTYSNTAKIEMLGVSADTLAAYGAVSEDVAAQMATGALSHSDADLAVSVTGIAGPGGSEYKPEGRVCFGLARGSHVHSETQEFGAQGRGEVRRLARDHALTLLEKALADSTV
ncbi:CinA family protein [Roseovarius aestuarii]|nr:CinA family protein [Roseovarius aestuarii]